MKIAGTNTHVKGPPHTRNSTRHPTTNMNCAHEIMESTIHLSLEVEEIALKRSPVEHSSASEANPDASLSLKTPVSRVLHRTAPYSIGQH